MGLASSTSRFEVYRGVFQLWHILTNECFACPDIDRVCEGSPDMAGTGSLARGHFQAGMEGELFSTKTMNFPSIPPKICKQQKHTVKFS